MKRRDRAREWLRKIRADVQDLLLDSHVFWEVQEIIRANPRLSAARSYFFHWLMAAHIEATVIGIRRQVKNDRQSVSLRRFLEELAQYPRPGGMVDVRWDGRALTMFFEDIQNRGEAVTKKRGEARSNHLRAASPAFLPRSLK